MNQSQILLIQVLANIGTFISSLIAIFTLYEVKKQRQSSMQPEVVIENFKYIFIQKNPNTDKNGLTNISYIWRKEDNFSDLFNKENLYIQSNFLINIKNIGLGIAKSVSITWEFDIDFFVNYLSEKCTDDITFYFDKDYNSDMILKTKHSVSFLEGLDKQYNIEYINNNDKNEASINFCLIYLRLVSSWLYFEFLDKNYSKERFMEICDAFGNLPKLTLIINYYDISNKKYMKHYVIDYDVGEFSEQSIEIIVKTIY